MLERSREADPTLNQDAGQDNFAPMPANNAENGQPSRCPGCCHCNIKAKHFKFAAYSFPIATAIREASETAIELQGQSPYFIAAVTVSNFCAELSIDSRFSLEGIEQSYKILKKRKLPDDWTTLSKTKEVIAVTSSALMGTYAAFCDAILTYDFVYQLPNRYAFTSHVNMTGWKALSGITAGFVGMGSITGEGMATYRTIRDVLAGERFDYSNKLSRYISPTVGCTLGVIGSCSDAVMTCTGMYDVFNITDMPTKITFGALSSINGVTDYCMNGGFVVECLDLFFGSFTPKNNANPGYKNPKAIAALALSLGAGTLLAYTYQGMAKDTLEELLAALGIDFAAATTPVVQTFACGGASSYLINAAGSLYPLCYKVADVLGNGLNSIYNKMSNCRQNGYVAVDTDFLDLSESDAQVAVEFATDAFDEPIHTSDDPLQKDDDAFFQRSDEESDAVIIDMDLLISSEDESTELLEPVRTKSVSSFLYGLFGGRSNPPEQQTHDTLKHSF